MPFILLEHGKQNCLTTSSANTSPPISPSGRSMSVPHHLHFHPPLFSKQTSAAGSQLKPFSPRSPSGFIKAPNIPILPHPPQHSNSWTPLLPQLSGVHPLPVLTPPPVISSVHSLESHFQSSATFPREIYVSWTQCFTPKTDTLGRGIPLK